MSEPAAKQPPSIDLEEFERRLRGPSPAGRCEEDPLAELARLVGPGTGFAARSAGLPKTAYRPRLVSLSDRESQETAELPPGGEFDPGSLGAAASEEPPQIYPASSYEDEQFASYGPNDIGGHRRPGSRRALFLMSGALVLVLAGIAFTFVMKRHVLGGGEAPTIKAEAGPIKVRPATPNGVAVADRDASLLDRSGGDDVSASRVVDRREEPIDLQTIGSQHPAQPGNAGDGAPQRDAAASQWASYFPAPKRVHTVTVRPDGTIISDEPPAHSSVVAGDDSAPKRTSVGAGSAASSNPATNGRPAAAIAASPETTARVATTLQTAAAVPGAAAAGTDAPASPPPAVPLNPARAPAAPTRPTSMADASPSDHAGKVRPVSASLAGGYAVQLAAPASERGAKEAIGRLEKKFAAELRGRRTAVEKADSNGRTVFRVRVVGLSSDDANVLCSRLKAGGGACWVVRD